MGIVFDHIFQVLPINIEAPIGFRGFIFLVAAFLFIPALFYLFLGADRFKAKFLVEHSRKNLVLLFCLSYFFVQFVGLVLRIYLTIYYMPLSTKF